MSLQFYYHAHSTLKCNTPVKDLVWGILISQTHCKNSYAKVTISETRTGGCHDQELQAVGHSRASADLLSAQAGIFASEDS